MSLILACFFRPDKGRTARAGTDVSHTIEPFTDPAVQAVGLKNGLSRVVETGLASLENKLSMFETLARSD